MLQSIKSAAERLCLRCAQHDNGHESPEERTAAARLLDYFGQAPKQELDLTDHGISAVTVRLITNEGQPQVYVWIGGSFEDSEAIKVSRSGTAWRWADHEDDNSGRWSSNLEHSHFAKAAEHIVRDVFKEQLPAKRNTIRASVLDDRSRPAAPAPHQP